MRISVVIPTHNRSDALAKTLVNLSKQEFDEPWEVIVVNNRSTDETDEVVRNQNLSVPLRLMHESKPGPAAARNAGAGVAMGEFLLFLDNDILVEQDFVQRHYNSLKSHPGCWILGQVIALPELEHIPFGKFRKALQPLIPPDSGFREARGLSGQLFSLPRADFERLGGFDETFSTASVEDLELALRAWQSDIRILFDPSIVGVHNDWAGSSIRDYCYRQRLYSRSEPLLWSKYGATHPRLQLVRENLSLVWREDAAGLLLRKLAKKLIGFGPVQETLFGVCAMLERLWPEPRALWRVYRALLSAAIYKGFQEGLAMHGIKTNGRRAECASTETPVG